ncbi:MAG: UDP-4-amino-4,6-dideoxy-N-acetyl-beta-L-altrosamine transaminase [Thermoleophilia bacterium]
MSARDDLIPYGHQSISEDDIAAVVEVLRSDFITQGPAIERFERAVADYCGARYAVAVANGTAALHLACLAAGLGTGDALWTSPNTFLASANCARYCGASVDFVDIEPDTFNMSAAALAAKLETAEKTGHLPKIVEPVHFAGLPCDLEPIRALAQRYGFLVLEDASHALGANYSGTAVGSCAFSDMTVLSFHPVKIITTGEGGMILTNRDDLYERLLLLRTHGMTRDADKLTRPSQGPWYYEQVTLGYNYRITDIQAALGTSQLSRVEEFVARRNALAGRYDGLLADLPVHPQASRAGCRSAYHLYVVRVQQARGSGPRREVFEALREAGVGVQVHYIPVHLQPYYRDLGFSAGDFPEAERYYEEALTLPLFYGLRDSELERVVTAFRETLCW